MVLVKTTVDFVEKSLQLLQARPSTTRITTTYNVAKPRPTKPPTSKATTTPENATSSITAPAKDTTPRGTITLKTYDPVSGAIVKYKTNKLADVGRLVAGLSRLGRSMAALPDVELAAVTTGNEEAVATTIAGTVGEQISVTSTPVPQKPANKKAKKKGKK